MLTWSRLKLRRRLLGRDVLSRWVVIRLPESNTWSSLDGLLAYLGTKACLITHMILDNVQVVVVLVPLYALWLDLPTSWLLLVLDR